MDDHGAARGRPGLRSEPVPTRPKNRILFLDDEDMVVGSVVPVLESLGFRVTGLTDPRHARELIYLEPEAFDLVITDQTMPGLSGVELAQDVHQRRPGLPVILCTGGDPPGPIQHLARMGIRGLLIKPVSIRDIVAMVRRVLAAEPDLEVEREASSESI
jgi:DNA-binding NtrC family response regulator